MVFKHDKFLTCDRTPESASSVAHRIFSFSAGKGNYSEVRVKRSSDKVKEAQSNLVPKTSTPFLKSTTRKRTKVSDVFAYHKRTNVKPLFV